MLTQPVQADTLSCRGGYLTESYSEVGGLSILTSWIRAVLGTQLVLLTRRMYLNADIDAGAGEHPPGHRLEGLLADCLKLIIKYLTFLCINIQLIAIQYVIIIITMIITYRIAIS